MLIADELIPAPWHPHTLVEALISAAAFGGLGIVALFVGYKVFDLLTPKLDVEKELAEKNIAVAIMVAALMGSIAYIVAKSISG